MPRQMSLAASPRGVARGGCAASADSFKSPRTGALTPNGRSDMDIALPHIILRAGRALHESSRSWRGLLDPKLGLLPRCNYGNLGSRGRRAVPTPFHFSPCGGHAPVFEMVVARGQTDFRRRELAPPIFSQHRAVEFCLDRASLTLNAAYLLSLEPSEGDRQRDASGLVFGGFGGRMMRRFAKGLAFMTLSSTLSPSLLPCPPPSHSLSASDSPSCTFLAIAAYSDIKLGSDSLCDTKCVSIQDTLGSMYSFL